MDRTTCYKNAFTVLKSKYEEQFQSFVLLKVEIGENTSTIIIGNYCGFETITILISKNNFCKIFLNKNVIYEAKTCEDVIYKIVHDEYYDLKFNKSSFTNGKLYELVQHMNI